MRLTVRVQAERFDVAAETQTLRVSGVGALVAFTGLCRDDGGRLKALELEHYPGMAEGEIERIANAAAARWPLLGLTVVHRYGVIHAGEEIVLVASASEHRDAAFAAATFVMDYMKTRAPFWKREHLADGTFGEWIAARHADDEATARWEE